MTYKYEPLPKEQEFLEEKICNKCQKKFMRKHKGKHTCPKCTKENDNIRTARCEDQGMGFSASASSYKED